MNDPLPHILADGADDLIKLIFGGLFVLIWIVGGLMSATKKKPQTRTPEKSWDEIFRELSGEPKRPNQQQQPPPPPVPVRFDPLPTPQRQVQRPTPLTVSGPPSGPAVRKKLRRKQSGNVSVQPRPTPAPTLAKPDVPQMPVVEVSTEFVHAIASDISKTEIGARKPGVRGAPSNPTFKALHAALRPENLRHQFILTELLQPPKALREEP